MSPGTRGCGLGHTDLTPETFGESLPGQLRGAYCDIWGRSCARWEILRINTSPWGKWFCPGHTFPLSRTAHSSWLGTGWAGR